MVLWKHEPLKIGEELAERALATSEEKTKSGGKWLVIVVSRDLAFVPLFSASKKFVSPKN